MKTSTKVRHFIPELVVSSYATTGANPWTEMAALSSPISGAEGGGNLITPNTLRDNLPRFKNVDAIGHPGGWAATQLASQSGYACASGATAFMPYYLSTLDSLAWRHGIPESLYPESLIPGSVKSVIRSRETCGATSIPGKDFWYNPTTSKPPR